jgi:hypothetical protein
MTGSKGSDPDSVSADRASAATARARARRDGIVFVEPDERIGVMLGPEERLVAVRREVSFERRKEARDPRPSPTGDLYVTTARLVCMGPPAVQVPLRQIRDAVVGVGRLRLLIGDGRGLEIRTRDPYTLRAEIGAAREAVRRTTSATTDTGGWSPDAEPDPDSEP